MQLKADLGNLNTLCQDSRFRKVPVAEGYYLDYAAVLTPDEVIELAAQANGTKKQLATLTAQLVGHNLVLAHIFEWESGSDW